MRRPLPRSLGYKRYALIVDASEVTYQQQPKDCYRMGHAWSGGSISHPLGGAGRVW